MSSHSRKRYALVGTGARAQTFVRGLVAHAETAELVAFADVNATRMAAHNRLLAELGSQPVPAYPAEDVVAMLEKEDVDTLVVTTADHVHDEYIVAAVNAGCDVITEKPMTTDVERCRRILDAVRQSGRNITVTFNYRYNPVHEKVREVLAGGAIGEIGSVHFEWLLDVRHGADYFRRWHRDKANSGGLMVHKASHHFDLINWWIDAEPEQVHALGRLFFYGDVAGRRHGYARAYERAHGSTDAADDPFALSLADNPQLRSLYLDAEHEDGYFRDQNVFAPGVTIEDDMSVLVQYSTGATLTYHLTAYSPWEGYRVMFNGSRGRLELEVVENDHVASKPSSTTSSAALHGVEPSAEAGSVRLTLHPFWSPSTEIPVPHAEGGHGGADERMTAQLFGESAPFDPLSRAATARDGALALVTGLAANQSFATGIPTSVATLLDLH